MSRTLSCVRSCLNSFHTVTLNAAMILLFNSSAPFDRPWPMIPQLHPTAAPCADQPRVERDSLSYLLSPTGIVATRQDCPPPLLALIHFRRGIVIQAVYPTYQC